MRILLSFLLALAPGLAWACACCVEKGERFVDGWEVTDYEREELAGLRGDGLAQLFLTACGQECARGVKSEDYEYPMSLAIGAAGIVLEFPDHGAQLSLPLAQTGTRFGVDLNPLSEGPPGSMYTELRIRGVLTATGIFAAANRADAEFVLAGQSNWCWNAGDLTHWSLEARGAGVDFRLFGGLAVQQ